MTCFAGYLRLVMDNVMESEALSKISPTAGPQPWLPLLRCSNGCQYDGDVTQLQRGFIRRGYLHSMHRHGGFARHGGTPTHHTCIQIYTYTHLLCIYMWYIHIYISHISYIYICLYTYTCNVYIHALDFTNWHRKLEILLHWPSRDGYLYEKSTFCFSRWFSHDEPCISTIYIYTYIYIHIFIYVNYIYICICIYIYMYTPDF